jgi:class 3 adenylate cyclase
VTDPGRDRSAIDELLDRAIRAINRGDRATADALAGRVLAVDETNIDAEELLAAPIDHGEIRRITILFADLVDSTELSTRIEPETYRTVVGRYRDEVLRIVNSYDGHVANTKGDGLLAVFGHPRAHENDAWRAVQAGLDITRDVGRLSARVRRRFGFDINARVGVHRGLVYLDTAQDDVYGFAANLAARMCSIADPGSVAVSEAVERLVRENFTFEVRPAQHVKGVEEPVVSYRPTAEREVTPVPAGPLIGRETELAFLETQWNGIVDGTQTNVAVAFRGEAGIGKSRLARAAIESAEQSDGAILELLGSPLHTEVGLYPIRKLLERRCQISRTAEPEERLRLLRTELESRSMDPHALVPLLAPVLGVTPGEGYEPIAAEGNRLSEQIRRAIHDYIVGCTSGGPALVLAEDMHWFDTSSKEVVQSLLTADGGRRLVVMTSRELASLPDSSGSEVFELAPLSDEETDRLVTALHPEMPARDRSDVVRRCDGVPLYIEEVVAKLMERPIDTRDSARVPDSLYEALFARLRSSEGAMSVVQAAAIIGSRFDRGLLQAVIAMTDSDFARVLDGLRNARVLEPIDDHVWRFRHELLREVAAELVPPSVRLKLHSRVADVLESASSQGDRNWPIIAGHFERADRFDEAVSAYQRASRAARHVGALGDAMTFLSRALKQLERVGAGRERDRREINLRLRHGFLAAAAEGPGSSIAAADFERCLELGATEPQADEMFATLMALFTYYVGRADLTRAQQIVESLRVGVDNGREWWLTENIGGSGTLSFLRGDFPSAHSKFEQSAELMADRGGRDFEAEWFMPHDPEVLVLTGLAQGRWALGDLSGASAAIDRSLIRIDELGFPQGPFSLCYVRYVEVWMWLEAGRFDRAAELAADIPKRAASHGFDQWTAMGVVLLSASNGLGALADGRVDAPEVSSGADSLLGWTAACRYVGAKSFLQSFDARAAQLLVAVGRRAEARSQIGAGLQLSDETDMHYYDAELLRLRASTQDDPEMRRADLTAAFEMAREQGAPVFALRAALDDHQLRGDSARGAVAEAVGMFATDSSWPDLARARKLLK